MRSRHAWLRARLCHPCTQATTKHCGRHPLVRSSLRAKWASSSCLLRQAKSAHYINGLEPSQAGSLSSPSSTCQWQFSVVFGKLLLRLSPVLFFLLLFHSSMHALLIIVLFMWKQEKRDHSWKWAGRWWHNCSLPCMWMPGSFLTSSFIFSSFWNQLFFPFAFHVILIKAWNNSFLQIFMINFIVRK